MIIVPTAVEANQTESHQFLDLSRGGVNHTNHWLTLTLNFPVHQKQVRKHLNIVKHELGIIIFAPADWSADLNCILLTNLIQ